MTGGAGSGKTFTVHSLIDACEDLGLSYELAAPTGKAAKRMEQSVKRPRKPCTGYWASTARPSPKVPKKDRHGFPGDRRGLDG